MQQYEHQTTPETYISPFTQQEFLAFQTQYVTKLTAGKEQAVSHYITTEAALFRQVFMENTSFRKYAPQVAQIIYLSRSPERQQETINAAIALMKQVKQEFTHPQQQEAEQAA